MPDSFQFFASLCFCLIHSFHGHSQLLITIRQIPYAIGQFTVNEWCHELAFRSMSEEQKQSLMASRLNKLTLDFGSGIVAGCAAAILSHVRPHFVLHGSSRYNWYVSQPADTLLSQINKGHGPTGSMARRLVVLARQVGFQGLFAGLGPRVVMTAGLVSGQFLLYGSIKDGWSL
jgi:solute carrier family 25 phosphate transporter 3